MIDGVILTPLKIIANADGRVMHGLKASEASFSQFGEVYFSTIIKDRVKAWKRHHKMLVNLVVPLGKVGFTLIDTRKNSPTLGLQESIILTTENYVRLTIPPLIWFGFKGLHEGENMVMNVASIEHDTDEYENVPVSSFDFDWNSMT